ncbi:MAG: DUF4349 domain-containing protein [Thermaurantimonas sp.]
MKIKCIALVSACILLSCTHSGQNRDESSMTYASANQIQYQNDEGMDASAEKPYSERLLIKNGSIRFKTEDFQKSKTTLNELIKTFKGFIQNENTDKYDNSIQLYIECKIPSKNFDAFVDTLERVFGRPESRNIRIEDITKNYRDTEARIQNKKELENRYLELLKKATTMADILEIESKLNEVRYEIEQYEQQKKYYDNQLAYSVLQISIYQDIRRDFEFFKKVGDGLHRGWLNFMWFVVWLVNLWPFVLMVLLIFGVRKLIRKKV